MKNGLARFDQHLNKLQELLVTASKQKNPALWLYKHDARTPLFMLEGLSKLYAGIHNEKKFKKCKEHFKLLEDGFGVIDYYDSFAKQFVGDKTIPAAITNYLQAQSREKIQSLNEALKENSWLDEDNTRIKKIRKKLEEADWQKEKDDIKGIHKFYITSITKILEFINEKDFHFTDLENEVHEFRRMIRWLSIYPQALQGCIQLSKPKKAVPKYLDKYLTEAIIKSKYNVMPDAGDMKHFLLLDQNRYYALSWMIAELGTLKDAGLKIVILKEAIMQTSKSTEIDALAQAYKLTGAGQKNMQQILTAAENTCKNFCKEKNLESLIQGIATIKK
jgi:hypothetical protein